MPPLDRRAARAAARRLRSPRYGGKEVIELVQVGRLRRLAGSETLRQPVGALTQVLHDRGVSGPADHLRTDNKCADVAATPPPEEVEGQVGSGLVDLLLTDRLDAAQQRLMRELRAHVQGIR